MYLFLFSCMDSLNVDNISNEAGIVNGRYDSRTGMETTRDPTNKTEMITNRKNKQDVATKEGRM